MSSLPLPKISSFANTDHMFCIDRAEKPNLKSGSTISCNIYYKNFGRFPAIGFNTTHQVLFATSSKNRDSFFPLRKNTSPVNIRLEVLLFPEMPLNFLTARSLDVVRESDIHFITNYDAGLSLLLCFEYFDISGNRYCTEICRLRLATGAIGNCNEYNKIYECNPQ